MSEDRILEYLLERELRVVNSYVAVKRKTLTELLKEDYPHVLTLSGDVHMFRKSELMLAKEVMGEDAEKLMLPIYVELIPAQTITTGVVREETATKLISALLGINYSTPLYVYPVQLAELRRKIGTLIQYVVSPEVLKEIRDNEEI
ncbi:MAG: DUF61 family protein [Desulfurococcaceae archaeon TW002]